jgi:hypothetical protein
MLKWIFERSPARGCDRLVLLVLADFANDQGACWPSMATIAHKANLSRRYTIDILAKLESAGAIKVERRRAGRMNKSNVYQINAPALAGPAAEQAAAPDKTVPGAPGDVPPLTTPGEAQPTRVMQPGSPDPSINPQTQPSRKPDSTPAQPSHGLFLIAEALAEVTGISFEANRGRIFREAKELARDATATPDAIRLNYGEGGAWYRADWRGLRGQKPALSQVRSTWGSLKVAKPQPGPAGEAKGMGALREFIRREGIENNVRN